MPGLGHRSAVAFSWGVFASVVKVVLTILIQAALARLLGPKEFGLFALAILVIGIAGYFADSGLATSLVQRRQVLDIDIRFVTTLNLITAAFVSALLVGFAGPISVAFGKPEAKQIFQWLAPVFLINALASVSVSLLRRNLDYRSIQLANLAGYALGFGGVGIFAAAVIGSVYALVAAYLCQALLTLALLYRKTLHTLEFTLQNTDRSPFIWFGANILATNLVNWIASSLDRLVVSRLFSSDALGHYSASFNLIYSPVGALYSNLQSTVFSSMAQMQDETQRMQSVYLELLRAVTIIFLPTFLGLFFFSTPLVLTVYGMQWIEAGPLAGPFCIMAPFVMIWACSTPVLWNTGRRALEWQVQLPFIVLALVVVVPAASYSILAVAWAATAIYVARSMLMIGLACRALDIGVARVLVAIWPSIWITFLVGAVAKVCAILLHQASAPLAFQLVLGIFSIVGAFVLCLVLAPAVLPPLARKSIGSLTPFVPRFVQPLLRRLKGKP